jgi:HRDC domain
MCPFMSSSTLSGGRACFRQQIGKCRHRWRRARERIHVADPLSGHFATGGLGRHGPDVHVRFLILPGDPEAAAVEFDEEFWDVVDERPAQPLPGAAEPVPGRGGAGPVGALEGEGGTRSCGHGPLRRRSVRPAEGMAPQVCERGRRARLRRVHDRTLAEIAERQCKDWADLAAISGVGPAKLERYAGEVLAVAAAG